MTTQRFNPDYWTSNTTSFYEESSSSFPSREPILDILLSPKPPHRQLDRLGDDVEEELFVQELNRLFHLQENVLGDTSRLIYNLSDFWFKKTERQSLIQRVQTLVRKRDYLHLILSYPIQTEPEGAARLGYFRRIFFHLNVQLRKINGAKGNTRKLTAPMINEEVFEVLTRSLAKYDFHLAAYLPCLTSTRSISDERTLAIKVRDGLISPPRDNAFEVPKEMWTMAVHSAIRQVSKCIEDGNGYRRIGISGIGSDKVTKALEDLASCRVIRCTSSQTWYGINRPIRDTVEQCARKLTDKFLLLVDSVDEQINLFDLEIPDHGFIVLTTHSKNVYEMMEVDLEIKMEDHLLPWKLFCQNAGYSLVHSSPVITEKAILLVNACKCHLLAIVLLATVLKHVPATSMWEPDTSMWELAIQELLAPENTGQVEGMSEVMIRVVKLIWDRKDNLTKHCIILWASLDLPLDKDTLLSELVQEGMMETMEEGEPILEEVSNSFLLEKSPFYFSIRRETKVVLADYFAARLPTIFLKEGGLGLTQTPKEELWNAREIYMEKNNLSKLPQRPNSLFLKKLFLQENTLLMKIPELFFENMPLLHILDLSYTSIKCLPPSVSKLVKLQTFYLRGCQLLMALPPEIGALVKLEVFDLEGTELMYLPTEIGELACLRCFKVSFCARSSRYRKANQAIQRAIPEKVLSRLIQMYELSIDLNPDADWSEDDVHAILVELTSLKKLKVIQLHLPSGQLLQQLTCDGRELILPNLLRFRLTVGCHRQRFISRLPDVVEQKFKNWETSQNCLKYINGEEISDGIIEALKYTQVLFIDRHWTVTNLSEFGVENMDKLKYCLLVECNGLETIIDGDHKSPTDVANGPALRSLRYLGIHFMKSLEQIWRGTIHKDSLSKLTFLHLHSCPNLITVFPAALCANLQLLESLIVEDCPKIKSLISQRAPNLTFSSRGYFLFSLKHISLLHLPELDSISNGLRVFPELQRLLVYDCPKLQKILNVDTPSEDVTIIGENMWWAALEWQDSEIDFPRPTFNELEGGQYLRNHVERLLYPESVMI